LRNKLKWSAASKTEEQTGFAGDLAWTLVSQTLGHADLKTTSVYAHSGKPAGKRK
jgi:hypothetical protein